jgi:hypothetical protein
VTTRPSPAIPSRDASPIVTSAADSREIKEATSSRGLSLGRPDFLDLQQFCAFPLGLELTKPRFSAPGKKLCYPDFPFKSDLFIGTH